MISTWDIRLQDQVQRKFKNYKIISLGLGQARTDKEYPLPGDSLQVISVSSYSAIATVKLNINTNEAIPLKPFRRINTIFTKFFISNAAQAGESIDFIVGIDFGIQEFEPDLLGTVQPTLTMTNALANTNTVGPNNLCNEVLLKTDVKNVGIVFVDINKAAIQDSCIPLDPGDWIVRRVPNTNLINANFEVANEKLFVSYNS